MAIGPQIKLGSVILSGTNNNIIKVLSRVKVQGTAKGVNNGKVTFTPIPGKAKEWRITISGKLIGSLKDTDDNTLQTYDASGAIRRYEDGKISGDFVIEPETYEVGDEGERQSEYPYTMILRQW